MCVAHVLCLPRPRSFFFVAQRATELASAAIEDILTGLRNRTITSVQQWQPLYRNAVSLTHLASKRADFTPRGAKWCAPGCALGHGLHEACSLRRTAFARSMLPITQDTPNCCPCPMTQRLVHAHHDRGSQPRLFGFLHLHPVVLTQLQRDTEQLHHTGERTVEQRRPLF